MGRPARLVLAIAGVALAVLAIVLWRATRHDPSTSAAPAAPTAPAPTAAGTAPPDARTSYRGLPASEIPDSVLPAYTRRGSGGRDGFLVRGAAGRFLGFCEFAPAERCERGRADAQRCTDGVPAGCLATAELLLTPPSLPHFAILFAQAGCELDDAASCDRWEQLADWMESGKQRAEQIMHGQDAPPGAATTACLAGDGAACGFEVMAQAFRGLPIDVDAAWRGCNAGVSDACTTIAAVADDAATVVRALDAGCRHGAIMACRGLVAILRGDPDTCCRPADDEDCYRCPAPDPARADAVEARLRTLTGKP